MTFQEIRTLLNKEKTSHQHNKTECVDFGKFTVAKDSNGDPFLIDSDMLPIVSKRKWSKSQGYLCTNVKNSVIRLHDIVMAFTIEDKPEGFFVDHKNTDKTDNRRINLRIVSPTTNAINKRNRHNNKTGVNGVCMTPNGSYRAYITVNKKRIELGYYNTLTEATMARKQAEKLYGFTEI